MSQVPSTQIATIRDLIKAQTPAIALAVGGRTPAERQRRAERFARICLTAIAKTPKLALCTQQSFASSMMTCAQLDLEPNTPQGLAYLIPYGRECQFQLGYRGMIQLMWRSGVVTAFNADVVYESEVQMGTFEYSSGIAPVIRHDIDLMHPEWRTGNIVAAYACCTLKSGQSIIRLVNKSEIEAARKLAGANSPAWKDHYAAMAIKTAIKRLSAWMPSTEIMSMAMEADEAADRHDQAIEAQASAPVTEVTTDALNAALAAAPIDADTGEVMDAAPVEEAPTAFVSSDDDDAFYAK